MCGCLHIRIFKDTTRRSRTPSGVSDCRGGVLDPKGGNETINRENFGRRVSEAYPMKVGPEIYRTGNATCYAMQRIRLRLICSRRGRRSRNLTARLVSARGHALRMVVHSTCSHLKLRHLFQAAGSHFQLRGHRHGMARRGTHDRIRPHRAFGLVGPHVHTRRHRHGSVVFACCSRSVTVGKCLVRGARQVTSPSRNRGRNQKERQQRRQRSCDAAHPMMLLQSRA
jgi:hypothetical protein